MSRIVTGALSREELVRLPEQGAGALEEILWMAARGDWLTRSLSLSAAGRIARLDPFARRVHPFRHWFARRIPALRRRFPSAGYQGKYVRHQIANALVDRSWIVRTAAALAVGECGAPAMAAQVRPLLRAPYRAERIAAAATLSALGEPLALDRVQILAGALAATARIGDSSDTLDVLTTLAAAHAGVLGGWLRLAGSEGPSENSPRSWASFMAGDIPEERYEGADAEIERYAESSEAENQYLLAKPFSRINRTQNGRLLHSFLAVAEQLRVPPGGRVLDLGAGSGWVSELLAKFGYRAVSLDLSHALLTLGQRRFTRERLDARMAVADMTRLPIASSSMDAVVVIDALHHVPTVIDVFREAFRVLADGGQFALAEPGEGHADTEKARSERLDHGVQEREVHIFEMADYARTAGFTDIRVVPHYVPSISMTPDDVRHAMRQSADQWVIRHEDRPGNFPQFLLQSMLCRPIMVFGKGQRPIDSRLPRTLKAEIDPALKREGARVRGQITLTNAGDTIWLGRGGEVGYVLLGLQLLSAERRVIDVEFHRVPLSANVLPGGQTIVEIDARLPDGHASIVLKIDLVDEGVCWFEDAGSPPVYVSL